MDRLDAIEQSVYSLVKKFVERQSLVLAVINDIRPDLLNGYPGEEIRPRPSKEYIRATTTGYWGKDHEWEYYFHGIGCRLTHKTTKECIEWNATNIKNFDPYWFCNWVQWLLGQSVEDESEKEMIDTLESRIKSKDIEDTRKIVFELLNQLRDKGWLIYDPSRTDMYALLDAE